MTDILKASENIIVHQVNELGVMGAGLALQIKNKYPDVYRKYKAVANKNCYGKIQLIRINEKQFICNMFSQRGISRTNRTTDYELLEQCIKKLAEYSTKNNLTVAIPYKIGCGLAGGDWDKVSKIIKYHLPNAVIYKK
jgi:O-acetyl-ADP-ribose deacetylase (regulator of RNase III)